MAGMGQMEGFLCPICMTDLGDVIQLQVHFDEKHSKEDPAFVQNLKDLFGKAKKKIDEKLNTIGGDNETLSASSSISSEKILKTIYGKEDAAVNPVTGIHYDLCTKPLSPKNKNHYDRFQVLRAKRTDRQAMDTNKLVIRLEKLLKNLPTDPLKRRQHEQSIVPWIPEAAVGRCPECTKSFNITRRKHHCRLCGSIMCNDCSTSVTFEMAKRIINPATISNYKSELPTEEVPSEEKQQQQSKKKLFALRRSDSKESLISLLDPKSEASFHQFRSCEHCFMTVNKRDQKIEIATSDPPIMVQFYERLQGFMEEGEEKGKRYHEMLESLNNGEENYKLEEAKFLRLQIMKIAEKIDFVSKKILIHGVSENDSNSTSGMALTLQKRIRQASLNFIKESLVGFQDVPSEAEYERLKQLRSELAVQRIEEEKNSARIAKMKYEQMKKANTPIKNTTSISKSSSFNNKRANNSLKTKVGNHDKGFVLSPSSNFITNNQDNVDPMLQQIDIIKGFIQEARNAKKFDEIQMLEANLSELQIEYQKTLEERKELEENYKSYKHVFKSTSPQRNLAADFNSSYNPFDDEEEQVLDMEDEYDKSGKNPFA